MKTRQLTLVFLCLLGLQIFAQAQTTSFSYQGKLTDAGNPANDNYDLQFKLFDALAGGAQQGATVVRTPVPVSAGNFTVTLDFGSAVFSGADRFLEIGVRPAGSGVAYTILSPRQPVNSTPYAIRSMNSTQLGGVDASQYVTTSTVGNAFIKNATTPQTNANFNIDGNGTLGGKLVVNGGVGIGFSNPNPGQLYVLNTNLGFAAVYGESATGRAVWGKSVDSKGVFGESTNLEGVQGVSSNNAGVSGISTTGVGVFGQSASVNFAIPGVLGHATGVNGTGVYGLSDNGGIGLYGVSATGAGVYGKSTSSRGVYGESVGFIGVWGKSTGGSGVYGETAVSSLTAAGVYGKGTGSGSIGVIGEANVNNAVGVYGVSASPGGFGGYFRNTGNGKSLLAEGTASIGVLEIAGGSDLAEKFEVEAETKPGMIVAIDPKNAGRLSISRGAYNRRVAGIVSGANNLSAGMVLPDLAGAKTGFALPVALTGRVWVYCDATKNAIHPGDLLTTATTPGHAMKVINHARAQGAIIGKAMTGLKSGRGLVLVLVSLQ